MSRALLFDGLVCRQGCGISLVIISPRGRASSFPFPWSGAQIFKWNIKLCSRECNYYEKLDMTQLESSMIHYWSLTN
jgi:hypothetical protein